MTHTTFYVYLGEEKMIFEFLLIREEGIWTWTIWAFGGRKIVIARPLTESPISAGNFVDFFRSIAVELAL